MHIVVSIKCSSTFDISIDKFPKMIFLSQIINEKLSTWNEFKYTNVSVIMFTSTEHVLMAK